jgi:phage-related protein
VANLSGQISKTETAMAKAAEAMESSGEAAESASGGMQQAGTVSDELASKIQNMSKIMSLEFAAKAAKAVIDSLKAIGEKCVEVGQKIYDITTAAGKYADEILTMAEVTNVDPVNLQKWEYASQFIDTSVDTMTGSLTRLTRNMTSESAATSEAFARLGVNVRDQSGNFKDSETVYWEVIDALGQVQNQTERDSLAMTLMGKSAMELNPLINAGSAAFRQLGDDAEAMGLIMSNETVSAFGALDDASNVMQSTITAASRAIAAAFMPAVQEIMGGATEVVQAFIGMVQGTEGSSQKFQSAVSNLVKKALKLLNDMLPKVLQVGVEVIKSLVNGIMENLSRITSTIKTVVTTLVNVIVQNLPEIISAGIEILGALIEGLIDAIPTLVANLPKIITAIVNGLVRMASKMWDVGKALVQGLWQGIQNMGSWLWNKLTGWVNDVFGWIKGLLGIHSPSTLMRDKIGKMMGLGIAEGILDSEKAVERALASIMPDANTLAGAIDGYSVASSIAGSGRGSSRNPFIDNRPIVIKLNDRELGRTVRGYA